MDNTLRASCAVMAIYALNSPPSDRYDRLDLSGPYVGERKKVKRNRAEIKKRRKQKHRTK